MNARGLSSGERGESGRPLPERLIDEPDWPIELGSASSGGGAGCDGERERERLDGMGSVDAFERG